MSRFAARGVPVLHLTKVESLAASYGLPLQPTTMPAVGDGSVFVRDAHNRWLAAALLAVLVLAAVGLLRFDLGHRLLPKASASPTHAKPEPMV